jgi:hypothetical protein
MYYLDPILELMSEIDGTRVEMEEALECGELEAVLELAFKLDDLERQLVFARAKEYD